MKEYGNRDIVVYWYPERCAHPGICVRTLPAVFCADRRPWIDVDAAEPEAVIRCIDKCPSGALKYALPEGSCVDTALANGPGAVGGTDSVRGMVRIRAEKDGPYCIEGPVEVVSHDGTVICTGSRVALCACGHSKQTPFCDGSHRHVNRSSAEPDN
jgi:uncharacterized Fe-S cluster protein YjdI/CDGSH-type Zn-finger protein